MWWERRVAERRGEWAPTGAAFALEPGPSLAGEATHSGQWPEDMALSAAHPEAWEGAGGSCVALVTWTQVSARLSPSLTFVPPHLRAQRKDVRVLCVCVCVCSKLFTLCKYIRNKFLLEAAPGIFGAEVVTATQGHPSPTSVLDDVLEQLHGTHDVLVLHRERTRGLVRSRLAGPKSNVTVSRFSSGTWNPPGTLPVSLGEGGAVRHSLSPVPWPDGQAVWELLTH